MECVVSCSSTRTTRGGHREPQTHTTRPNFASPRIRETSQQNGGPLQFKQTQGCVGPVRSDSREGDHQTVSVGMEGMQGIEMRQKYVSVRN